MQLLLPDLYQTLILVATQGEADREIPGRAIDAARLRRPRHVLLVHRHGKGSGCGAARAVSRTPVTRKPNGHHKNYNTDNPPSLGLAKRYL